LLILLVFIIDIELASGQFLVYCMRKCLHFVLHMTL